jgi:hypothetical protein
VQAVNDFILFTIAGAGSLISGYVFQDFGTKFDRSSHFLCWFSNFLFFFSLLLVCWLGWNMLIYVVSVLMVLYLFLFISALGGKKKAAPKGAGFDDINQPLIHQPEETTPRYKTSFSHNINNNNNSINNVVRSPMMSGDRDDFVPINYHDRSASSSHYTGQSRGKSFTEIVENITQRLSISIRAEEFDQGNDEIAPLRTMSVA